MNGPEPVRGIEPPFRTSGTRGLRATPSLRLVNLLGAFLATMTVIYAVVAFVGAALIFGTFLTWVIG